MTREQLANIGDILFARFGYVPTLTQLLETDFETTAQAIIELTREQRTLAVTEQEIINRAQTIARQLEQQHALKQSIQTAIANATRRLVMGSTLGAFQGENPKRVASENECQEKSENVLDLLKVG